MACTATRRKPFTSPFSLTMATRCTRGTGYSRLLRYTKALQEQSHSHGRPSVCAFTPVTPKPAHTQHEAAKQSKAARQPERTSKVGWEQAGGAREGGGFSVLRGDRRWRQRGGNGLGKWRAQPSSARTWLSEERTVEERVPACFKG